MKLYRNIIILISVIVFLALAMFFVVKYLPENEKNTPVQQETEDNMFNIYQADGDSVSKLRVKNAGEEYTLTLIDDKWILNNDPTIKLKQTNVKTLVYSCTSVSVKKIVAESSDKAADYGFSTPTGFVEILFNDGSRKKIMVGNKTLDGQDYYVMISDDSKIYLRNTYGTESMIPQSQSLRDLLLITVDMDNLNSLDHFNMSKQGNTSIKLKRYNKGTDEEPMYQWRMIEPVDAEMNGVVFSQKVANCFESFNAKAVVEDHPKNLNKYGLDNPYAQFSIGTPDGTRSMKIGNKTSSYRYLKEDGQDTVYLISESDLTFLDIAYIDLMSMLIHVENIVDINKVEIVYGSNKYEMEIKGDENNSEYSINGKIVKKEVFSKAYQAVIGIRLESVDVSEVPDVSPSAYIKYIKKDNSEVLVEFLPIDERNMRVIVDGKGSSITNKKNIENAINTIQDKVNNAE